MFLGFRAPLHTERRKGFEKIVYQTYSLGECNNFSVIFSLSISV